MPYEKVKGLYGYYKDKQNNIVLNTNDSELRNHKEKIDRRKELNQLKKEVAIIQHEIEEIKKLIKGLYQGNK